jgi:hypothetical protein
MSCLSTRLFSSPRRKPKHESDTTRIAERNFNDRNITRSRHLSHRQRLASPPDCFPTLVAKVAGKQRDSQCKKSNPLRTTSRAADTFQSANVLPLHPIVFLRSSQTATEKANASGVDCATLSATAPHTGQPRKERIAAHFTA